MRKLALTPVLVLLILAVIPLAQAQTNYATIPDDYEGNGWNIGSPLYTECTYPVTFQGETCVLMPKNSQYPVGGPCNRELDSNWYLISPGETITYRAYLWTNASAIGDTLTTDGARIGMDFYGALDGGIGRINEVGGANGEADWNSGGYNYYYQYQYEVVPWNSGAWVQLELSFTVPEFYYADAWGSYPAGTLVTPTCFTAWVIITSINSWSETAAIYFRDAELYINDDPAPTPTVGPTPTATPTYRPMLPSPTNTYFLPEQLPNGIDALAGLCAVLAVGAIIFWPFIEDFRRR